MPAYTPKSFTPGGYRYLPSVFQYSAGVAALPGFRLEQVRFKRPRPLPDAFTFIESYLPEIGRPFTAFAHCELRSPKQFNDQEFIRFNQEYVKRLQSWGIYSPETADQAAINPVARTNVVLANHAPSEISMAGFSYTVVDPKPNGSASFILSGGGDAKKGPEPYRDRIIAYGDTSSEGLKLKMSFVIAEMTNRLTSFGHDWHDVTKVQAYSIRDIGPWVKELLSSPGCIPCGLTWHYAQPPVAGLDYEMDARGNINEIFI